MIDFEWLVQKSFTPRQLNRLKSIKGDVLVTFQKEPNMQSIIKSDDELKTLFKNKIENWLEKESLDTNEIFLRIMKMIFSEKIIIGNVDLLDILSDSFSFTEDQKWSLKTELEHC